MTFDLPAFNGAVRLAAVAWTKDKVGSAQADVTVRDPVVVSATLPRFLDVGDRSQMSCRHRQCRRRGRRLYARPRPAWAADGGRRRAAPTLHLDARISAARRRSRLRAAGVGVGRFRPPPDRAEDRSGASTSKLGIASGAPDVYRRTATPLPGGASATVSGDAARRFHPRNRLDRTFPPRRSARSTRRPCCRRSTATPMAAPSRRSAARCRSSTPTGSPRSKTSGSIRTSRRASSRRSSAK